MTATAVSHYDFTRQLAGTLQNHLQIAGTIRFTESIRANSRTITITCEWPISGLCETFDDIHRAEAHVRAAVQAAERESDCLLAYTYDHTYRPSRLVVEIVDDHGRIARPEEITGDGQDLVDANIELHPTE